MSAAALLRATRPFLDYALPARCPGCGVIVPARPAFCLTCWRELTLRPDLGEVMPPGVERAAAACAYDGPARTAVMAFKHGNRPRLARLMAGLMLGAAEPLVLGPDKLLVPVPLHPSRLWSRRYNQAALLAGELARLSGAEHRVDALRRTRRTAPQHHGRAARAHAVADAFALSTLGGSVAGRRVVLIDDVLTTGATASTCARVLRAGGAGRVDLLCWAAVLPHN